MSYLNNEYEYAKNSIKRKKREMKKEEEVYKNEIKKEISSIENENRQILNKYCIHCINHWLIECYK